MNGVRSPQPVRVTEMQQVLTTPHSQERVSVFPHWIRPALRTIHSVQVYETQWWTGLFPDDFFDWHHLYPTQSWYKLLQSGQIQRFWQRFQCLSSSVLWTCLLVNSGQISSELCMGDISQFTVTTTTASFRLFGIWSTNNQINFWKIGRNHSVIQGKSRGYKTIRLLGKRGVTLRLDATFWRLAVT